MLDSAVPPEITPDQAGPVAVGERKTSPSETEAKQAACLSGPVGAAGAAASTGIDHLAHELKNLLTVIRGYSDLVGRRPDLDGTARQMLEGITRAAERASELTRRLATVNPPALTDPVALAPNVALRAVAPLLQAVLGPGVGLDWDLAGDAGEVLIDRWQFDQIVVNLAVNARDAMPAGGRLTLSTARVLIGADAAAGRSRPPGAFAAIAASDTGVGMDERTRRRCFEPSFTTRAGAGGTGLGLAVVHHLVTKAGGVVSVTSAPGRGSRFEILLPSVGAPRADQAGCASGSGAEAAGPAAAGSKR